MNKEDIRTIRKKLGLTQKELAKVLGVQPPTIQSWEYGTRKISDTALIVLNSYIEKRKESIQNTTTDDHSSSTSKRNIFPITINSKEEFAEFYMTNYGAVMTEPRLYDFQKMKTKESFSVLLDELENRYQK